MKNPSYSMNIWKIKDALLTLNIIYVEIDLNNVETVEFQIKTMMMLLHACIYFDSFSTYAVESVEFQIKMLMMLSHAYAYLDSNRLNVFK
ncbi:hypothetical protein DERF_010844 [Dermatophagoides farinae]|uniref:Uncharacterized protein n=1 Tax=Dermatophagoides farinae TaxID=6954 RepID=A0A922HTU2_DERFA|nr:hypothetical protein DERF_010844 [Dermatophagoides farinae]